ncbi:MAG: FmdB family zinc ribbon protein [Candidatus Omnitrophota bacterium]
MPTYEYECNSCGYKFEKFQQMSDKHLEKCPKCQKKVRRLISSGGGIIFKGSGFYANDYKKKPHSDPKKPPASTCPKANEGCQGCQNAR